MFERSLSTPNGASPYHFVQTEAMCQYKKSEILVIGQSSTHIGMSIALLRPYQFECMSNVHLFKYKLIIVHQMLDASFDRIKDKLAELDQPVWLVDRELPKAAE